MQTRWRVPATTANLGPGFDVLGMALDLYNEVEMEVIEQGVEITVEGEGAADIKCDEHNLVYQAALDVFERAGFAPSGLRIHLCNRIPVTRGLGSSSAALVGGLVAANRLCGDVLSREELLDIATQMEGHPDNVAPVLYGGFLVAGQVRGVAKKNDLELFGQCLEDRLHQSYRADLIPGMKEVIQSAEQAGALGAALSGAGPSFIAFTEGLREEVGHAMQQAFAAHGVSCRVMYLYPDLGGVRELVVVPTNVAVTPIAATPPGL